MCMVQNLVRRSKTASRVSSRISPGRTLVAPVPWTEEPGWLQSMGSLRVRHDQATSLSLFPFMHWRKKWQPTPVFLPGESQGWGSLVAYCLWGHKESDMTKVTQHSIAQLGYKADTLFLFYKPLGWGRGLGDGS